MVNPRKHLRRRRQQRPEYDLAELRKSLGVSQGDLAEQLGTTQPAVLKTERSDDPQVSTVRRYIAALGSRLGVPARLELVAVIDGNEYLLPEPQEDPVSPTRTGMVTAWRLRAWNDSFLERRFLDDGIVAMSDDELGDLTDWPGDTGIERMLRDAPVHEDRSAQAIGTFVRYWRDFRIQMSPGDIVVVPLSQRRAAIGEITGVYEYVGGEPERKLRHRRTVRWLATVPRDELDDELRKVVNAPGTICRFGASAASDRLVATARQSK